ncbi:MAG: glycosyltransferase [Candidatus Marinimicrobia bacterium]|nr:glycosyltransferase [Candidatus Neomarinimicrobiota bacterium]
MKIKIIQKIVPSYRQTFFSKLHFHYGDDFQVYTSFNKGHGPLMESVKEKYSWIFEIGKVYEMLGLSWQSGVFGLEIKKNDVIIIEGSIRIISNFIIIFKAWLKGAKLVWWGHYLSASSKKYKAGIRHKLIKKIPYVLFYTEREVEYFYEEHNRKNNIFYLNNGVDFENITKYRNQYIAGDIKRDIDILFLGRLTYKANIELLLKALLDKRCKKFNLVLVGAQDEFEYSFFNRLIDDYGLDNRVLVAYGSANEKDISYYANRSKIFCYPGQVGLSLIHAMGYGLPTVVHGNRKQQMPEFCAFIDKVTGISFKNNDPESLAQALNIAIKVSECETISSNCVKVVESKYTLNHMKSNFINMIDGIK